MSSIERKVNQKKNGKNFFEHVSLGEIPKFDINNYLNNKNKKIEHKINYINKCEIQNNSNLEEDDYNFSIYNKSILKDEIFINEKKEDFTHSRYNTISSFKSLNLIKKKLNQQYTNIFNISFSINSINENSNLSYEKIYRNSLFFTIPILLSENKKRFNFIKITNNFYSIHKERKNNIKKHINEKHENSFSKNLINNSNKLNINKTNFLNKNYNINKKSKFSKKYRNKDSKKIRKNIIPVHNRNVSNFINSNHLQNKILKVENISNINCKSYKGIKNKIPNNINYKMYDGFIININKDNLTERDEVILRKNFKNNKSLTKTDFIDHEKKSKNLSINNLKLYNHPINFINLKKISNIDLKTIINSNPIRDNHKNIKTNYKSKNREGSGFNKIVKRRVILEEEYLISPKGEKRLLSVKRLGDEENINPNILDKYFKKEKNVNLVHSNNYGHTLNKSLFSSIFQETSKERNFYSTNLKSLEQNLSNINIINNNNFSLSNKRKNKNIVTSISRINNKNKRIDYNLLKSPKEIIHNRGDNLKEKEQTHALKIKSELNNKEIQFKKKLFYNKISLLKDKNLNKFNKCYNNTSKNINSLISSHTNFLNGNRNTMNYIEDKNKYLNENSKNIYERISLTKDQPLTIYHNEDQSQSQSPKFIINNNHNCPNLVNIVFLNNEEKKNRIHKYKKSSNNDINKYLINKRINIPQPKLSSRLKRTNYRFHEIRSISIDNNQGIKSIGYYNNGNKKILHTNNSNSYFEIKNKNKNNIYSSLGNLNKLNLNTRRYFEGDNYYSENI